MWCRNIPLPGREFCWNKQLWIYLFDAPQFSSSKPSWTFFLILIKYQEKIKLKSHTTHFLTCERQQGGERGGLHSILVPGTMSQSIGKQIILKMIGNFSTKSTKTLLRNRNMASYVTYLSMRMSVMYMPGTGTTLRLPVAWGSFWNKNNSRY